MTSAASLLTPPKVQGLTQVELLRQEGELSLIDKLCPETGELTLLVKGKTVNEHVTHGEIESCIAEELQPFVVRYLELRILVDVGSVKERIKEELPVVEAVEESTFELLQQGVGIGRSRVQSARRVSKGMCQKRILSKTYSGESIPQSQASTIDNGRTVAL